MRPTPRSTFFVGGERVVTIDLLKNHPESIPALSLLWQELLGKIWLPNLPLERVVQRFEEHLNSDCLPLTLVAFDQQRPIGMCSLRESDGIRSDLKPWLGSLIVDPAYQKRGISQRLIDLTKAKAQELGFERLYLFTFDPTLPSYYARLGWMALGMDQWMDHPVTVMEIGL